MGNFLRVVSFRSLTLASLLLFSLSSSSFFSGIFLPPSSLFFFFRLVSYFRRAKEGADGSSVNEPRQIYGSRAVLSRDFYAFVSVINRDWGRGGNWGLDCFVVSIIFNWYAGSDTVSRCFCCFSFGGWLFYYILFTLKKKYIIKRG